MAKTEFATRPVARTRNDLPEETRARMIALCNQRLADCVDLQTQAKQAHWNVKGPSFYGLHTLFDDIYKAVGEYVDLIAERAVQLGGRVEGTVRVAAERSTLPEYPHDAKDGMAHVNALAKALSTFGRGARAAIDEADDAEDKDTADVFTEISRGIDKWLWFVEAHGQADR
jgi:starvation-inducible DNA-binding protein